MTALPETQEAAVDVVFPLAAPALPRDHAQALQQALCAQWPWLAAEPLAGIHPVKLVLGHEEPALLSGRARLTLRVGARRAGELLALDGLDLVVSGYPLHLGRPHLHALQPHGTLYAYKVAADTGDEVSFMAAVSTELAQRGIRGETVCGKRQRMAVSGQMRHIFSLMLHQLSPAQSLRLQQYGLGPHRLMGCGLFVPHKSAAAVGA